MRIKGRHSAAFDFAGRGGAYDVEIVDYHCAKHSQAKLSLVPQIEREVEVFSPA